MTGLLVTLARAVLIAPPEGQSFARDIAEKYGVTYESLTAAGEAEN